MLNKIMLIDGNSIINRAFFALPTLTNSCGDYTNAIYGFLNIFFKLYDEEKPNFIGVAFDLSHPTFRHKKYDMYKSNRKSMLNELRVQIPVLKNLLLKMNIDIYEEKGFEADDILGTLAKKYEKEKIDVVIVSGDRDLLQLATDNIKIRIPKTKKGKTEIEDYYKIDVINKIGVTPTEYIDVKALMGDSSDNIPGVPGIGEKTAVKIIKEYKNIENVVKNAKNIKTSKISENITKFKEQIFLNKELVTILLNAPVNIIKKELYYETIFNEFAFEEIKRLEFKSMFNRFLINKTKNIEINNNYKLIEEEEDLKKLVNSIMSLDCVFTSIVIFDNKIEGLSFTIDKNLSYFIEFNKKLKEEKILKYMKDFFQSNIKKVVLDSKKYKLYLKKNNITLNNVIFDCVLACYILNSSKNRYDYNDIAEEFLNISYISEEELLGKGKNKKQFCNISKHEKILYSCNMSFTAYSSYKIMEKNIYKNNQEYLYFNIELPLVDVLVSMEMAGIKVDIEELTKFEKNITLDINKIKEEIYLLAQEEFNINSPSQLGVILFQKLGLKGGKKTKTGYSTSAEVLEKLKSEHTIIEKILEYRTLTKLKSTYCEGLFNFIDKTTSKIYSNFNQIITTTGRISSTEPNLQNIPIKMEIGKKLRKIFVTTDDSYIFLDGDYNQIELRILAHISKDDTMIKAYKQGADIHTITASQILNKSEKEVSSKERSNAKAVNFGIIYGISSFSLSQDLNITRKEADDYIKNYFGKYPKIKEYLDKVVEEAKKYGFVKTIFNRRRNISEINSTNFIQRSFGQRVAMNMPIQGSAADIIKIAMVRVYKKLKEQNLKSRILLQVHDELLLEVKKNELEVVKKILKEEMENTVTLQVPLYVDINEGKTWFDIK